MVDALTLHELDAGYGDSHVLHQVSLVLPEGRTLALLGRNGAGKTTCMGAIMGFVRVRGGHASAFGKTLRAGSPEHVVRQGVGIVPQGRRIFPSLTVRENLVVAARKVSGGAWTAERVFQTFPRLRERVSQRAGLMSGGEQQMLAIGRALMGNPRVLLLDEPSEGLSPKMVTEIGETIALLKREGLSMILVEQNVHLALSLADDVALLNTGRVVVQSTAAALAADPATINRHLGVF
ncbi:MAG: ABC transporter ATP-binding protein [Janthinobacterium lividum]